MALTGRGGDVADIDAIIDRIVAQSRAKGGRAFVSSRVFGAEPILMRGSQLASYLPERVAQMRALARSGEARSWTDARLFVEQGRLMADYEDDRPYAGVFQSYFPTYDVMDNQQLRGYFTWRSRVRAGHVERTSASFAYVYLYELINGIGVEPGEGAFRAIESFWRAYREYEPSMDRYARPWLVDYAAYHDLDPALAEPHALVAHDRAVEDLRERQARVLARRRGRGRAPYEFGSDPSGEKRLLAALDEVSTYRLGEARLFRDEPDALRAIGCAVFDRLVAYYHTSRSQDLVESLFGVPGPMPHLMFASAVFYPGERHPDCTYDLAGVRRYECRGGIWTLTSLHDGGQRSARLGQALRAADRQLRAALDYPHPLKERGDPKYLTRLVEREVRDYIDWRASHAPVRVEIDLSRLDKIRSAAAVTREALLVDEERDAGVPEAPPAAGAGAAEPPGEGPAREDPAAAGADEAGAAGERGAALGLSREQLALLADLLAGRPPATGSDLLVDEINERLFDLLGDTAVEFDEAGRPALVPDYVYDVSQATGLSAP